MNALFKNRAFMLVMASDILQQFAIWIRNMALLYFIMERTNNDQFQFRCYRLWNMHLSLFSRLLVVH